MCVSVCADACLEACVVFVGFYDALAGQWFIFGLDSAALVRSGYVLLSFVHLFRHLTCPEINTAHTSTHRKQQDSVMPPEQTGFTPAGSSTGRPRGLKK